MQKCQIVKLYSFCKLSVKSHEMTVYCIYQSQNNIWKYIMINSPLAIYPDVFNCKKKKSILWMPQ